MRFTKFILVSIATAALFTGTAFAQIDPGVQLINRGAGQALSSVASNSSLESFFTDGLNRFQNVEEVSNAPSTGLGPRFNFNQCAGCHAQPAVGGSGAVVNPQFAGVGSCANGESSLAQQTTNVNAGQAPNAEKGTIACNNTNATPFFITQFGPTREARFPFVIGSNGQANTNEPDGGVHDLFVVSGRADAGQCNLAQPNFNQAANDNDLIFRIPTPTFGTGLVENLAETTLLANRTTNLNNNLGITGSFNHNGNDGTITKFGWKAQNKSLHIFAGEAYNVEMGITNLLFTTERPDPDEESAAGLPANCLNLSGTGYPEDTNNPGVSSDAAVLDDVSAFADFMRLLAPPPTGPVFVGLILVPQPVVAAGESIFNAIGCGTCHNATPGTTQASNITTSLSNASVNSFSDFEIHSMGNGLADNVSQGGAGGQQFRTAPLWGLGQRIFLLHDGRTTNLITAIEQHASSGSEANQVVTNFNELNFIQQQEVLDFLRSL